MQAPYCWVAGQNEETPTSQSSVPNRRSAMGALPQAARSRLLSRCGRRPSCHSAVLLHPPLLSLASALGDKARVGLHEGGTPASPQPLAVSPGAGGRLHPRDDAQPTGAKLSSDTALLS